MGNLKCSSLFLFFAFLCCEVACSSYSSNHLCPPEERSALLQFGDEFAVDLYGYHRTLSWKNNATNCCLWDGVTCDRETGHVIELDLSWNGLSGTFHPNSSLFHLNHLQRLDLRDNDFRGSQIPPSIGRFKNLTHLDLSRSSLSGPIPSEICFLSGLVSLDLSSNDDLTLEEHDFKSSVKNLTHLQELRLYYVNISSTLPDSFANLSSLVAIDLKYTGLQGYIPTPIFFFPNLKSVDFGGNGELKGIFPQGNWTNNIFLTHLDLHRTGFSGRLPDSFGNLKSLGQLDLSYCDFSRSIPKSIGNLTEITYLDLSYNNFVGPVPSTISNLKKLTVFSLGNCNFSGPIPISIGNLKEMIFLDLSYNKFIGPILTTLSNMRKLSFLDLSSNDLTEDIPDGLFQLEDLEFLCISDNAMIGPLPFNASGLQSLKALYLSNNLLNGTLPPWLFTLPSLMYLNISSNQLTGAIHDFNSDFYNGLLDLSHNYLDGAVPTLPVNISYISMSHNKFTGAIPLSICSLKILRILDVTHNDLSNTVPQCLGNSSSALQVLDLKRNRFRGVIPSNFSESLMTLNLNDNDFEGPVPNSLAKCKDLEVLDLGNNNLTGHFPHWLESLPQLKVLVLHSNRFHGLIEPSRSKAPFPLLRVFDLSNNNFTGHLPACFLRAFAAMKNLTEDRTEEKYMHFNTSDYYYTNTIELVWKGSSTELVKILRVFTSIDLSSNKFEGQIPDVISMLDSLRSLNLSHNNLCGHIPASLGNLTKLESLDLSHNELNGEIPEMLTSLTFLEVLNLSKNHLVGRIPSANQFSYANDSYAENPDSCGVPLSKVCGETRVKEPPSIQQVKEEGGSSIFDGFTWQVVMLGYGCGTILGLMMGSLMFYLGRPKWFSNIFVKKPRRGGSKPVGFRRTGRRNRKT